MVKTFGQFSMQALYATLDVTRTARRLTWSELATQINQPFAGTPSIPISVSTLRGMANKRSVTSAVVLQVLAWLDRTPESFLIGSSVDVADELALPSSGPGRILRFDTTELYAALDHQRTNRELTWKQVAGELPGFTESMLRNLAEGPLIGFPRVMVLTQWLQRPAADFVYVRHR
jgi:hypothetical protein